MDEFAQKMTWEQGQQDSFHTDLRIIASKQGYTLRDLKSGQEQQFTGPDAEEQCLAQFRSVIQAGKTQVSS
jgi:hypothetical protein